MPQLRGQSSDQELKHAINQCASEPIYIPSFIQTHGCLIAMSYTTYEILQVSQNIEQFVGKSMADCLGANAEEIFGKEFLDTLHPIVMDTPLQPVRSKKNTLLGKNYDVTAHISDKILIIEMEPAPLNLDGNISDFYDEVRNFSVSAHTFVGLQNLFDHVVTSIRNIIHFDRVKLYKFDAEWNGFVIAEDKADFMPSYLGMYFPDTDILEQARILYTKNCIRLIPNIYYGPAPITPALNPETKRPLDLSLAMLRSVSPSHIQYLENMRIRASMSISIIQNGKLWGLIACHNNLPLHVSCQARMAAEIMGHIFSAQLSALESQVKSEERKQQKRFIETLYPTLQKNYRLDKLMDATHELALSALQADGIIVSTKNVILKYGDVPGDEPINTLLKWLAEHHNQTIFTTLDAADYPELETIGMGFLSSSVSQNHKDFIVWFRSPFVQEISWAGNPEKPVEEAEAGYHLTPRTSFKIRKQKVKKRCAPWTSDNIDTARSVVNIILEGEKISVEQANRAKTDFLTNMSHEIRTPMNAVIGLTTILSRSEPLTIKQRNYIDTLKTSADLLLSLINDLLDISKIESGNMEFENIPFDMRELIDQVTSVMSVRAQEKRLNFVVDAAANQQQSFKGDPARIRQVILHLCSNAVKFTDTGTVKLQVKYHTAPLSNVEEVIICVVDTGVGIEKNKLQSIFNKFGQTNSTVTQNYGGTGLGLAISKSLIQAMGGTIKVSSEPGKGSEFTINLRLEKLTNSAEVSNKQTAPMITSQAPSKKILLVEDHAPNILVATLFLQEFGYAYDVASNGKEAFELYKKNTYHAVLMDVQMHGMNGFETTQLFRSHEKEHNIKPAYIIGMTAHALLGDREKCVDSGMNDYISKPFNPEILKRKLQNSSKET